MNDELQPCPFCGYIEPWIDKIRWFFKVSYNASCVCGITQFEEYKTREEAAKAWNKRVADNGEGDE